MRTHNGFLLMNKGTGDLAVKFFFTLRDLIRQARMPGDYAVRCTLIVEDEKPVWEGVM